MHAYGAFESPMEDVVQLNPREGLGPGAPPKRTPYGLPNGIGILVEQTLLVV